MDRPVGVFATVAGLLVAAEGRERVPLGIVDRHLAGAHPGRDLAGVPDILRLHIGRQPVDRVVGDPHRLVLVVIGDDRQDGAEDFLLLDRHAGPDVAEHSRPHIIAAVEVLRPAGTAGDQRGALLDAGLDQPLDLVELHLAHHRAEPRVLVARIADLVGLGGFLRDRQRLVVARRRHQHPRRRVAGLA